MNRKKFVQSILNIFSNGKLSNDEVKKKLSFKQYPYEPEYPEEGYYWALRIGELSLVIEEGEDYAYLDSYNYETNDFVKYYYESEVRSLYYSLTRKELPVK